MMSSISYYLPGLKDMTASGYPTLPYPLLTQHILVLKQALGFHRLLSDMVSDGSQSSSIFWKEYYITYT